MKIIFSQDIKNIDNTTIEEQGITSIELVDRAVEKLTDAIIRNYNGGRFHIFAGAGNNGADAIGVGILLHKKGYDVNIIHFNINNSLSEECQEIRERLKDVPDINYTEVIKSFTKPTINENDIIIDGIFGTGLNRPLTGGFESVVKLINKCKATVFSIDIPSGLMCEDNTFNVTDNVVKATKTFTIQFPKLAFFFSEFSELVGELEVLDINLSQKAIENAESDFYVIEKDDITPLYKKRKKFTHKGNYGKVLLIAGSSGKAGAATLAAKGCLRSGVGILKIHTPGTCVNALQTNVPEAMVNADYHEQIITSIFEEEEFSNVAIGPGIGKDALTAAALEEAMNLSSSPMVIDADAINIIAENRKLFKNIPAGSVLTPHIKEFDRLIGLCNDPYERVMKASEISATYNVYIVLKNAYTMIIAPNRNIYINPTGNPGMATGGSGDVLTGVIVSLLAQGYNSLDACMLGCYVHGMAGDIAAEKLSMMGMTSMDIAENLPYAWKEIEKSALKNH